MGTSNQRQSRGECADSGESADLGNDADHKQAASSDVNAMNLDTGEVEDIGHESLSRLTTWKHTSSCPSSPVPWDSWWKLRRRRIESLFEAAANGDAARINLLCRELSPTPSTVGADLCHKSEAPISPVDAAEGVQTDTRGLYGRTALHLAADAGHLDCVETLLHLQASVDAQTDSGGSGEGCDRRKCCVRGTRTSY